MGAWWPFLVRPLEMQVVPALLRSQADCGWVTWNWEWVWPDLYTSSPIISRPILVPCPLASTSSTHTHIPWVCQKTTWISFLIKVITKWWVWILILGKNFIVVTSGFDLSNDVFYNIVLALTVREDLSFILWEVFGRCLFLPSEMILALFSFLFSRKKYFRVFTQA